LGSSMRLYRSRLSRGLCGGCGYRPVVVGRSRCSHCKTRQHNKYLQKRKPNVRNRSEIKAKADPDNRKRAMAAYRAKNTAKCIAATKASNRKLRLEVLSHYGNACACCGNNTYEFLTLHHKNNDGATHRKEIGTKIYMWAKRNGFPDSLEVNCMNCNWAKGKYGTCPHERKSNEEVG
jgi:hypothetical protein